MTEFDIAALRGCELLACRVGAVAPPRVPSTLASDGRQPACRITRVALVPIRKPAAGRRKPSDAVRHTDGAGVTASQKLVRRRHVVRSEATTPHPLWVRLWDIS